MFLENSLLKEKIYSEKLSNNMQVFIMPKSNFNKKYAVFATNFGSNDLEYINPHTNKKMRVNNGIAHFLEHKMFEMPDESSVFEEFARLGASPNAYTNFNMTAYYFSATNNFEKSLKHLINYVQTPYFTDENVEKEKGIIAQEINMYDDDANWRVFFNCLYAMYKNHPNSIDIAGTVDSIYKITKEELYDCYNTFYSPSNMALFIAGDVDINETMNVIKSSVKNDNMFDGKVQRIGSNESDEVRQKEIIQEFEISAPVFCIGYKEKQASLNSNYNPMKKMIEMDILNQIIFKEGSNLHEKLYDNSLIFDSLSVDYTSKKDYGYVTIDSESNNVYGAKNAIIEEIEYFKKNGIKKEQFDRVKKQKLGSFIRAFDRLDSISSTYLSMYFSDIDMMKYKEVLDSITICDLQNRFVDMFDEKQMVISIVNPKNID